MATTRTAKAHWEGSLMEGAGKVALESSGIGTYDVSWASRANEANGKTSPEELIAAAHSTCFSMALAHALAGAGNAPESLDTQADVDFQPGEGITGIKLSVNGKVPGITADEFAEFAETAKKNCPVSQALSAVPITLDVTFTA
ncbi:OsmC family peroxiredoxin [Kribbella capetownensis]|uniref:OsmC family peroxiredoxin n=1 Tax=Kribbella capetownensis TaxID=1572659 RepID=A0A4R0JVM5_9ACTN|nr:OsmC family peroxiredoxin [Kribbella capetownensis]TCC50760.1 OsmC family peroxiredoxin [Kribbella capetownensis]